MFPVLTTGRTWLLVRSQGIVFHRLAESELAALAAGSARRSSARDAG